MKILHVLYELKFSGAEIMYVDAADEFRSLGCELYVINSAERLGKYADMFKDAGYKVYPLSEWIDYQMELLPTNSPVGEKRRNRCHSYPCIEYEMGYGFGCMSGGNTFCLHFS